VSASPKARFIIRRVLTLGILWAAGMAAYHTMYSEFPAPFASLESSLPEFVRRFLFMLPFGFLCGAMMGWFAWRRLAKEGALSAPAAD
jgi:hypothetical protein